MAERDTPLGDAWKPGSHGNFADGTGVTLHETRPGSIVQIAAFRGSEAAALAAAARIAGAPVPETPGGGVAGEEISVFATGPGRFILIAREEGVAEHAARALPADAGSVTDLSHGRTVIRLEGDRAEWVLSKLFAIDFDASAFRVGDGRATMHHDIHAQIQRIGPRAFDIVVFRSFARAFWMLLCRAADEVGYLVR